MTKPASKKSKASKKTSKELSAKDLEKVSGGALNAYQTQQPIKTKPNTSR